MCEILFYKFKVVCSVSLTSAGNNWDCDKRFAFYFSLHDMFRRLAPCSRGGFYKNDKLSNIQQTKYLCPQEKWEWGQRFTKIPDFKKSWPQRGFSSLGQSGRLSPPPLLLTGSAHCRFCLSGTCDKTPRWWRPPPASWWAAGCWLAPVTRLLDGDDLPQLVGELLVVDWHLWQDS